MTAEVRWWRCDDCGRRWSTPATVVQAYHHCPEHLRRARQRRRAIEAAARRRIAEAAADARFWWQLEALPDDLFPARPPTAAERAAAERVQGYHR